MQANRTDVQKKEAELQQGLERTRAARVYVPLVDIVERKEDILVVADMPGVDEKSVDVTLEKNVLTIYGKVEPDVPTAGRPALSEYGIGDYHRSFTISDEIDRERIQATVKNGVMKLVLPKAETVKTRKITIVAA